MSKCKHCSGELKEVNASLNDYVPVQICTVCGKEAEFADEKTILDFSLDDGDIFCPILPAGIKGWEPDDDGDLVDTKKTKSLYNIWQGSKSWINVIKNTTKAEVIVELTTPFGVVPYKFLSGDMCAFKYGYATLTKEFVPLGLEVSFYGET